MTGERAHYELAAGRPNEARRLLQALGGFANECGMIPEQLWDANDIAERELLFGRPSGSAMPLVWAHSEYVKPKRSLRDGRVFDTPPQTVQRYQVDKVASPHVIWRYNHICRSIPPGKILRLEVTAPVLIRWSADRWLSYNEVRGKDTTLGIHVVDLPTAELPVGAEVLFTFYWPSADRWEGRDFSVTVQ